MLAEFEFLNKKYCVNLAEPIDISMPLRNGEQNANCFWAPPVEIEPVRAGDFVGSVELGGPVNFVNIKLGGPVRMIVPWSHGYKSIKWLQHIFVTNDARINDTYSEGNNDPDSFLKTAAYLDKSLDKKKFKAGEQIFVTGQVMSGLSGVKRVEYWLRPAEGNKPKPLADDAPEMLSAPWQPCQLEAQPDWRSALPSGVKPQQVLGFDKATGKPTSWPPHYGMCSYWVTLHGLKPGKYEVRARSVDLNDFAQPEPRPSQKSGKNAIQVRRFEVV